MQRCFRIPALLAALLAACSSPTGAGTGTGSPDGSTGTVQWGSDGGTRSPDGGRSSTCKPRTCAEANANCGPIGDGCGGMIECGATCPGGESCGGGGTPSQCGSGMMCLPATCQSAQANCGPVADGCGGIIQCGSCIAPATCGGETPSVCSGTTPPPCTGFCGREVTCPNGTTTTLTGIVHAPTPPAYGAPDPLYGALVYIPSGTVEPFPAGVSCDRCGAVASGNPFVKVTTGPDGKFKLTNVPVGDNVPLVIQLGRWRRQITIPKITPCTENILSDEQTRMPRNHTEGDIPLIAMATGSADPLECVLRKIGIDDSEFTLPGGGGRVEVYTGNGAAMASGMTSQSTLTSSLSTLEKYDMVIFACWGEEDSEPATDLANVVAYANAGGRIFATHYSYAWLYQNAPFSKTATWDQCTMGGAMPPNQGGTDSCNENDGTDTATVDQSFTRGQAFAEWLQNVNASTTLGQIPINSARFNFDAVDSTLGQRWLYDSMYPLHYTFNTPVGAPAGQECGRVLFSDFHVNSSFGSGNFPDECDMSPLAPQEKALEFMLFDLSSCVPPPGKM